MVANPHVAFSSVVLERLTTVLGAMGLNTLVVDAADSSPAAARAGRARPARLHRAAVGAGLVPGGARPAAAPCRHARLVGAISSTALQAAAPQASVLLVHAGASDLARLFTRRALRPVLLAADHPESLTHAYAAMKLLAHALRADEL